MIRLGIAALTVTVQLLTLGQGTLFFSNRIGTEVNARFILCTDPPGTSSIGGQDWSVLFFGGPTDIPTALLQPLDPAGSAFKGVAGTIGAGYFFAEASVSGVPPGGDAKVVLRLQGPNGFSQDYGPFMVMRLGSSGGVAPANVPLGTTAFVICIPEPSLATFLVGGLGTVAWRIRFRSGR
jgi:hypothetical protein